MMKTKPLTRQDILELILEHAENQSVLSSSYVDFIQDLSDADLETELSRLEDNAQYGA